MKAEIEEYMLEIGRNLLTQDGRMTNHPVFLVQVLERHGPLIEEYSTNLMFYDHHECGTYYADRPDPEEWKKLKAQHDKGELPAHISCGGYFEQWKTVAWCLTEAGAEKHLEINGHNYRHHFDTRVYVDSAWRNPEIQHIREYLMQKAKDYDGEEPATDDG